MKVTIELTKAQVKGIKKYLQEVGDQIGSADEIKAEIKNIVDGNLYAPKSSMADYIRQAEQETNSTNPLTQSI